MNRAMIKRELAEAFSWAYRDRKTGNTRPVWKNIILISLYAIAFAWLMHIFYKMARAMCLPMMAQDLEWLFMALMGLLSMSVVGLTNTFHAYAALGRLQEETQIPDSPKGIYRMFRAKFTGTYIMGLFYSLVFMIPGVIVHLRFAGPNSLGVAFALCIPLILGLLSLVVSCVLAYIVAAISSRIKNKNILSIILSVAFLGGYYVLYVKSQDIFSAVLENAADVAYWTKIFGYPLYQMGKAAQGSLLSMGIFCACVLGIAALTGVLILHGYRAHIKKRAA